MHRTQINLRPNTQIWGTQQRAELLAELIPLRSAKFRQNSIYQLRET